MTLQSSQRTFSSLAFRSRTYPRNLFDFLQVSANQPSSKLTQQYHAQILVHGFGQNAFFTTKLISSYANCGSLSDSLLVFDFTWPKDVFIWNSLMSGYLRNNEYKDAFILFSEMQRSNQPPDDYTLATMAKVCGEIGDLVGGSLVHGKSVRVGFVSDTVFCNSLMSMYSKCGEFKASIKVFDEMPERNSASWNTLLSGFSSSEEEMWDLVRRMQIDGIKPDAFTVSSLLPFCGRDSNGWNYGREVHCYVVKNNLDLYSDSDVHLGCCLIDMYSRNHKVIVGRRMFDQMKYKNVYAWTAMITGYVLNGDSDEALVLFSKMQVEDGIEPNRVSLVSILPACSSHARILSGKQIHGFGLRRTMNYDTSVCNALIDMYSKCGSLVYARRIFDDESFCKDSISWTAIISGYGLHGQGKEAVILYDKMVRRGFKPDMITIVGVLSACDRSGLVNEGLSIYNTAIKEFRIEPSVEICASVVDILGRSGRLDRALEFIKSMPVEPGPSVWGALLTASIMCGDSEMQELAYNFLIKLEPHNPSNFISLSNFCASFNRWEAVAEVRKMMKERGLKKTPGWSWITVKKETHCFHASDKSHPSSKLIYESLDYLMQIMKGDIHYLEFENLS